LKLYKNSEFIKTNCKFNSHLKESVKNGHVVTKDTVKWAWEEGKRDGEKF